MAGYSGTPLPKKLGCKAGETLLLIDAPRGFEHKLQPLPEHVTLKRTSKAAPRILLFVRELRDLERGFERAAGALEGRSGLWICWPKKSSGIETDLNENLIRDYALARGWVDFKVCAVDDTWSGLQLARRQSPVS